MNDMLLPSHLSTQEINYYNLDSQYKTWSSELRFLEQELSFFSQLLYSERFKNTSIAATTIEEDILTIKHSNQAMLDKVISYRNQLESLRECEDVACDTFYLNDHQRFKAEIETHLEKIRDFKRFFYTNLIV